MKVEIVNDGTEIKQEKRDTPMIVDYPDFDSLDPERALRLIRLRDDFQYLFGYDIQVLIKKISDLEVRVGAAEVLANRAWRNILSDAY